MMLETLQDFVAQLPDTIQTVAGAGMKLLELKSQVSKAARDSIKAKQAERRASAISERRASAVSVSSVTSLGAGREVPANGPSASPANFREVELSSSPEGAAIPTRVLAQPGLQADMAFAQGVEAVKPPPMQIRRGSTELEFEATQELAVEVAEEQILELEEQQHQDVPVGPKKPLAQRSAQPQTLPTSTLMPAYCARRYAFPPQAATSPSLLRLTCPPCASCAGSWTVPNACRLRAGWVSSSESAWPSAS